MGCKVGVAHLPQQQAGQTVAAQASGGVATGGLAASEVEGSAPVGIVDREILLHPQVDPELDVVPALHPVYAVAKPEAVINGISVDVIAQIRGGRFARSDTWKHRSARARNAQQLVVVPCISDTRSDVLAVGAVETHIQVVQKGRREHVVVPDAHIVSEEILSAAVQRGIVKRRRGRNARVVARSVAEVQLALVAQVLVEPEAGRRIQHREAEGVGEVVARRVVAGRIGIELHEAGPDRAQIRCRDLVPRKCRPALHPVDGPGGGRVEDLPLKDIRAIARVDGQNRVGQVRREIASLLRRGWNPDLADASLVLAILLPAEEEERPVLSVVDLGNPDGAAESRAVIMLLVQHARQAGLVVEESVRIELLIAENIEGASVHAVGARLQRKALDTAGGSPHLRGKRGGGDAELADRVHRRRRLVERGSVLRPPRARTVQHHFRAVGLAAVDLGLEGSAGAGGRSRTDRARRQKYERLRRTHRRTTLPNASGRSRICFSPTTVAMTEVSPCTVGALPFTTIVSVTCPGESVIFNEVVVFNCTVTPVDCAVLNPLYSALTS